MKDGIRMNMNAALKIKFSVLLIGCCCCEGRCSEPLNTTVTKEGFAATYYAPQEYEKPVGVIVLGGSEGGTPHHRAQAFSEEGYAAMALAYFKAPGTPDTLDEIPLEYFDKPIEWFSGRPEMEGRQIVLVGGSKGGELALLLASRKTQIRGVIAISPSSVVFQGIPKVFWPPRSSWTSHGDPVPFVPYDISKGVDPQHLRPLYEQSLSHAGQVAKAAIPVEKINGPLLLLTGEDDRMWPASDMAETMIERLKASEFAHSFEHVQYSNAGHTLNEFYMIGGTKQGNEKARLESNQKIVDFLSREFDGRQ